MNHYIQEIMFSTTLLFRLLAAAAAAAQFALFVSGSPIAGDVPLPLQARAPQQFVHPGVVIDRQQLDFVRSRIEGKEHPWYEAYQSLVSNRFGDINRPFHPRSVVDCGFYNKPDYGCRDEEDDALTAYAMALLWYVSGQKKYADRSIAIMNGWAKVITAHTNKNAPIQAGWAGASWSKAAEIIRYSNAGWRDNDIERFKKMLREVYLPLVIKGSNNNGNWELVMMEAAQGISVFIEDRDSYDKAMQKYFGRVPAYVYLQSDGPYPKIAPGHRIRTRQDVEGYWFGQKVFNQDGLAQETCRDFSHLGSGLSSMAHIAETARIQGWDVFKYTDVGERLKHAYEFHTKYQMQPQNRPDWLCKGKLTANMGPVTEVAYNALGVRMREFMPQTKVFTKEQRPAYTNWLDTGFETLSHALESIEMPRKPGSTH